LTCCVTEAMLEFAAASRRLSFVVEVGDTSDLL
jgi:hypothetical protein